MTAVLLTTPTTRRETRSCKVSAHTRTLKPKPSMWESERHQEFLTGILASALEAEMGCFDAEVV